MESRTRTIWGLSCALRICAGPRCRHPQARRCRRDRYGHEGQRRGCRPLPIARVPNLAQAIRTIKEHNIFVYCADLGGAPLAKTDLSGPVALVLGSEGGGPGALTRKLCDAAVTLEMAPGQATGVDSYNVSVAAGILCYDVMRRRIAKK